MSQSARTPKVLRELDVFISDELDLYLLQFPLRPQKAGVPRIKKARFKPKHNVLELGVDHEVRDRGDSIKMTSTVVANNRSLGIGVLKDGALHITPLQNVIQMRPSVKEMQASYVPPTGLEGVMGGGLEHLKPNPVHVKEEEPKTRLARQSSSNYDEDDDGSEYGPDDENDEGGDNEHEGNEVKDEPLGTRSPVVPLRKENERQQNTRLMSYAHHSESKDGESFNELDVYTQEHPLTGEEFDKLFYNAQNKGGKDVIMSRLKAARDKIAEAEEKIRVERDADRELERKREHDSLEMARQIALRMESKGTLAKSQATLDAEAEAAREKEAKKAKAAARKPRVQVAVKTKKKTADKEKGITANDQEKKKEKAPVKKANAATKSTVSSSSSATTKTRSGSMASTGSKDGTTSNTNTRRKTAPSFPQPAQMLNDIYNTDDTVMDDDGDELVYGREGYRDNEQDEEED